MKTRARGRIHQLGILTSRLLAGPVTTLTQDQARSELGLEPGFDTGDPVLCDPALLLRLRSDAFAAALRQAGASLLLSSWAPKAARESLLLMGVGCLSHPNVVQVVQSGDDIVVDLRSGTIEGVRRRFVLVAPRLSDEELELFQAAPAAAAYGLLGKPVDPDVYDGWKTRATIGPAPQGT